MNEFADFPIHDLKISKTNSTYHHSQYKDSYKKKYLPQRKSLIQLLRSLSECKALYNNEEVFYLSLTFLDQILCSNYLSYTNNNLTTIAICCFSLALKFIGDFNDKIFKADIFKVVSFRQFEFKCIAFLQYNLSVTSVFDHLKILTIGSIQLFQLAKKILLLSVNQDFYLNYDNATFALGICNFAKDKLNVSCNARQSKGYLFHKDKESLSLKVVEIVSLLKNLEKNKRNTLSSSLSCSSFETMKQVPELLLRDDCSDSTTYSTHSQQSNDNNYNYNNQQARVCSKNSNQNQVISIKQKRNNNESSSNHYSCSSTSNSISLTSRMPLNSKIQPIKTIETMRTVFHQNKTRNLAIDLTQMSKINFTKLNSLSGRFLTNQK